MKLARQLDFADAQLRMTDAFRMAATKTHATM